MTIEVGQKIRGNEIVFVSENKNFFATYCGSSLGDKGKIFGKMFNQEPTFEERFDMFNHGIQTEFWDGVWWRLLEYCADYPMIFARCNWYATNRASAYREVM